MGNYLLIFNTAFFNGTLMYSYKNIYWHSRQLRYRGRKTKPSNDKQKEKENRSLIREWSSRKETHPFFRTLLGGGRFSRFVVRTLWGVCAAGTAKGCRCFIGSPMGANGVRLVGIAEVMVALAI